MVNPILGYILKKSALRFTEIQEQLKLQLVIKKMKNHLVIAVDATSLDKGGGLTVALRLWQELSQNYPVKLHVWYSKKIVETTILKNSVSCTLHPFMAGRKSWERFIFGRMFLLAKQIQKISPNVVWTTNFMVHSLKDIPQIVHQQNLKHFLDTRLLFNRLLNGDLYEITRDYFCRKAISKAVANVYISDFLMRQAVPYRLPNKMAHYVVHNPITNEIPTKEHEDFCSTLQPIILSVTSASPHKDNPTLFRTIKQLINKRPQIIWKLIIVGAGDWFQYGQIIKEYNISSRVEFGGYCNEMQLSELYKTSFCLLNTSSIEAFGNAPIEAMAFGCPVIAAKSSAMPEIIGNAGILITPGDDDSFSNAIMNLWDDVELRKNLIRNGKKRSKKFTTKRSARFMYEIFYKHAIKLKQH